MKRPLKNSAVSITLCVVMLVSCLFGFSVSSYCLTEGDFELSVSGGNASITGYNGSETKLSVPSTLGDYNVTGISLSAFKNCTSLVSIDIPQSVTLISSYAFDGCTALEAINVDSENTKYSSVDGVLFNIAQTSLYRYPEGKTQSEYTIPDTVTFIGPYAFANAGSLSCLNIPGGVTAMGDGFITGCTALSAINVGSGNPVYSSSDGVLFNVDKTELLAYPVANPRTAYTVPDTVLSIGNRTFADCTALQSVILPESVTAIYEYAFYGCTSLKSISIPSSVTDIYNCAFYGCTSLESLLIYYGVESIGSQAFSGCEKLSSVIIPDSVTNMDGRVFENCKSLESITLSNSLQKIASRTFLGCDALTSVDIPDSVTLIDFEAFAGCKSLASVSIPDSVEEVFKRAFVNCPELSEITLHSKLEKIGEMAFGYVDGTDETLKVENFTVYGYNETAAQEYAEDNGFIFVSLDIEDPPVIPDPPVYYFPDVRENDWFWEAVQYNAHRGFITGYKNGRFGPADPLQRQDFVVIIARIAGADVDGFDSCALGGVDMSAYYGKSVAWAVDKKIITGYNNGKFGVGDRITREQVATILYRYMGSPEISDADATLARFPDGERVSDFARNAVAWANENGIINGKSDGRLAPTDNASRAEIATIIMRMDKAGMFEKG